MIIKDRVNRFLVVTQMTKATFCKNIGIVSMTLRNILAGRNTSPKTEDAINAFIDEYKERVKSV